MEAKRRDGSVIKDSLWQPVHSSTSCFTTPSSIHIQATTYSLKRPDLDGGQTDIVHDKDTPHPAPSSIIHHVPLQPSTPRMCPSTYG
ncbi:hypothetical protein LY78DRAFT_664292, partial [Colletotrichum sublineola]